MHADLTERCTYCGLWWPAHRVTVLRTPPAGHGGGLPQARYCPLCYAAWWAHEERAALALERGGRAPRTVLRSRRLRRWA